MPGLYIAVGLAVGLIVTAVVSGMLSKGGVRLEITRFFSAGLNRRGGHRRRGRRD